MEDDTIKNDLGIFYFNCREEPLNSIVSPLSDHLSFPYPSQKVVTEFPYKLPFRSYDMYVLDITDPECELLFNVLTIKPGIGVFIVPQIFLDCCKVSILNHQGPLTIKMKEIKASGHNYQHYLLPIKMNFKVDGRWYRYYQGIILPINDPEKTILDYPDDWHEPQKACLAAIDSAIKFKMITKISPY